MSPTLHFTPQAKHAILSIESGEDRVETILFILQTAMDDCSMDVIQGSDIITAQLMVDMKLHLLDGID